MSDSTSSNDFLTTLGSELKKVWQDFRNGWWQTAVSLRNGLRRLRRAEMDYVVVAIGGAMPERADPPRSFIERQLPLPDPALSLEELNQRLARLAEADNVRGLVLICQGISAGFATVQNVRRSLERLKAAGKTVVVYTAYLDLRHYFLASVADRLIVPPTTQFDAYGLHSEITYLKNGLNRIGVGVEVVQISPYKASANPFVNEAMTPEEKEQFDWLLDDLYDQLTQAMANGRSLPQTTIQELMNQVPLTAEAALAAGLVDDIAYQDELACLLADAPEPVAKTAEAEETTESEKTAETDASSNEQPKAVLVDWPKAERRLTEVARQRSRKFIGVISIEGAINMGSSQSPPIDLPIPLVGGQIAGEQTLVYLLRQAEQLDDMAGLILYVNSPGGSALASDLIGREIQRLNQKKPVLAYMGNTAASGGYYVSAYARHIMSQPLTVTGSIGVVGFRLHTQGLYEKLGVNRVALNRGEHAGFFSDMRPLTPDERTTWENLVVHAYGQFKEVVAEGRQLPYDELDAICLGRVWTGRQALERQLVDSHGDFIDAVHKVAELANLPDPASHDIPVINLYAKNTRFVTPQPFEIAETLTNLLAPERLQVFNNKPLYLLPFSIQI
ncbi:MAG: signal peptide peptidase SppA [Anaerolineaceae bacterium]|nr:signal peptide peptidase SppA [Anaerolineaceae bacterium]